MTALWHVVFTCCHAGLDALLPTLVVLGAPRAAFVQGNSKIHAAAAP
jgi:hypothetical protein